MAKERLRMKTPTTKQAVIRLKSIVDEAKRRAWLSVTTVPASRKEWSIVLVIIVVTMVLAGIVAVITGFIDPIEDFYPPTSVKGFLKAGSAFIFPSLVEELFWRGIVLPHPSTYQENNNTNNTRYQQLRWAGMVLVMHVLLHPLAGYTVWSRGLHVFADPRFLVLATIVLGGTTVTYLVSGGSIWAAAITHGVAVAVWRDFFHGEAKLMSGA